MRNVNIIRKPGTMRPITVTADSVHITQSKGFFKMENCELSFGNDDCFNVNDQSRTGINAGETILHVTNRSGFFKPGDKVEFRYEDYSPAACELEILSEKIVSTSNGDVLEMQFSGKIPGKAGDRLILFNTNQGARNIILRNNYFHDNRSHGMRLQAKDITVENNRFENHPLGVALTTGYTLGSWCEGYGASNIILRNNVFSGLNTGGIHHSEGDPAIYIGVFLKSDPSEEKTDFPIIGNILFENNTFIDSPGVVLAVSSAGSIFFRNNRIHDSGKMKGIRNKGAVWSFKCNLLDISGNKWSGNANAVLIGNPADAGILNIKGNLSE
jgi:hypothetical protein